MVSPTLVLFKRYSTTEPPCDQHLWIFLAPFCLLFKNKKQTKRNEHSFAEYFMRLLLYLSIAIAFDSRSSQNCAHTYIYEKSRLHHNRTHVFNYTLLVQHDNIKSIGVKRKQTNRKTVSPPVASL